MIYLGSDHGGFKLKQEIKKHLDECVIKYVDLGNLIFDKNDDYPIFAKKVAVDVAKHKNSKGILICGSSHGMCIAANKVKGIRAVSVNNLVDAKLTREHNNANVLCLSGWNLKKSLAIKISDSWLNTKFSHATRHKRRLNLIE